MPEITRISRFTWLPKPVFGTPGIVGIGVGIAGTIVTLPAVTPVPPPSACPMIGVTVVEEPEIVAGSELGVRLKVAMLPTGASCATSQVTASETVAPAETVSGEVSENVFEPLTIPIDELSGDVRFVTLRTRQSAK